MVAHENVSVGDQHREGTFHKIKMANLYYSGKRDRFSHSIIFDTLSKKNIEAPPKIICSVIKLKSEYEHHKKSQFFSS